jgi:hypothetical protein
MGARFSNEILQTLLVVFKRRPPKVTTFLLPFVLVEFNIFPGPALVDNCDFLTAACAN